MIGMRGKSRSYFFPWDATEILKIKLSACKVNDVIAWHNEKSGIFTVCSAYRLAMSISHNLGAEGSSSAPTR